ncbi:SCP2 sterol-binding domain-containing protein [Mycobacterium vicinigordonae]|uniref:SCP2 sterol-binding domain-containing protein n=1 Tax=Mycobacterium vicinigordonae TaxID=1719132 RepID=A0A7D6E7W0_9MYCO|nr:SCP2 sterol-binding domain-containing protein [Mycobacterium vicinigordonae]QLL09222.1 SCP2 sterol-binding domain-containing protein [Mycobacterium vicinigordonae]
MKYASQEWLDRQTELQQSFGLRPGATARVQYRLTSAPDGGEIRYHADVRDGRAVEQRLGDDPAADGTMTASFADSTAILRGELAPTTAFMEGRIKLTGNVAKLGALMPLTRTAEYQRHITQLCEETDFS